MIVPVPASQALVGPLWWALRTDIRLAGIARPAAETDFEALLVDDQLTTVVSLVENNLYDCSPLRRYVFPLEDLYGGAHPLDSADELDQLATVAAVVRDLLDQQQGVLVHCEGGTGRTGTVIGAVLVTYGVSRDEVTKWLDEVHRLRGKPGWPESAWQRDALLNFTPEVGQPSPLAPPGTNR